MVEKTKSVVYICVGFGLLVLVYWIGSVAYFGYKWEKKTKELQKVLSKPYREDILR